jgi:hypothetical protein
MMLKFAVLAPTPKLRVLIATKLNVGSFSNIRTPKLKSCQYLCTVLLSTKGGQPTNRPFT